MLILPKEEMLRQKQAEHEQVKEGLCAHFNSEMEKILNDNSSEDLYWILGKVRFPEEYEGKVGKTFLQACKEKPGVIKDSFVYEVDNRRGVKTLLWLQYGNNLRFPTINKTVSIA